MKNNRTFLEKLLNGAEVEWKTLGEVAKIQRGASPRPISQYITDDPNGIPWIKIGDTTTDSKYIERTAQKITPEGAEKSRVLKCGDFVMSNSMSYGRPYILKISGAIHDGWASISDFESILTPNFLYYYLSSNPVQDYWDGKINSSSVSNLNSDIIKSLPIPIPPLSVQTKIVKILDALTALTSELTSELILRRKQYEYYREKLLSFDSLEQLNMGGAKKKLIDVAKIKNGKDWKHLGEGDIPIYGSGGIMGYVDTYSYNKPTVLIPRKGSITNIFYLEEPFWNVDTIYYTEINTTQILPKYFFHFMKTVDLAKLDTGSGRPSLTQAILNEIPIFVPSIEEQQRIVSILDKFEDLTNSITEGLPLAIEQSQKRYEYYREVLLNFS